MDTIIHNTIHVLLALTMPPLLLGVITKTKALFAGRVGPPLLAAVLRPHQACSARVRSSAPRRPGCFGLGRWSAW